MAVKKLKIIIINICQTVKISNNYKLELMIF